MDDVTTGGPDNFFPSSGEENVRPGVEETPQSVEDFISQQWDAMDAPADEPKDDALETATDENTGDEPDKTDVDATDETTEEATASDEVIQPPQSMSAKDREAFYQLPPEQQKWLTEREKQMTADYTRKNMEVAEKAKTYDRLEQIIAPRRQALAMQGLDEGTAIGQLFAYSDFAEKDPVGFARYLLEQRQIPLSALTETDGKTVDPQLAATQQQLASVTQYLTQQQQAQKAQAEREISTVVEDFAKDPAFQYYSDLEQDMIPIVASIRQSNPSLNHRQALEKAYRMALAANEDVSAKVEADKQAKAEAERIKKAKEEAAKAKKGAGVNLKSSPALPAGAAKAKSVDEFIGALVDERMVG